MGSLLLRWPHLLMGMKKNLWNNGQNRARDCCKYTNTFNVVRSRPCHRIIVRYQYKLELIVRLPFKCACKKSELQRLRKHGTVETPVEQRKRYNTTAVAPYLKFNSNENIQMLATAEHNMYGGVNSKFQSSEKKNQWSRSNTSSS